MLCSSQIVVNFSSISDIRIFKFQVKVMTIKDEFYVAHSPYECALMHFTVLFGGLKSDFIEQFTTFEREFSWSPLI